MHISEGPFAALGFTHLGFGIFPAMLYSSWEVVSLLGPPGIKRKLAEVEAEPWRAD